MATLVSFLWHMHQPFYKDIVRNFYVMPWAYLHGTKDYFGMAALAGEFPDVHQTFNLVPSLIVQLEEYARGTARDPGFDLAFKPAADLTDIERMQVLEQLFPVPVRTMIQPSEHYLDLHERRGDPLRRHTFSEQDFRDVQALWTLAWLDNDHRPEELIHKGKDYTEDDKIVLQRLVIEIISNIVPEYRRQQDAGAIEISTSPFYHPILPLLIDSRVDDPSVPVEVRFPEDAREQLKRAREFMRERFGHYPRGLWPSEGSVSNDVAELAASLGFEWMATDEGILAKSGVPVWDADRHRLFRPYQRGGIKVFFRDRGLSDLIGFHYMNANPRDAARDLVNKLKEIPANSQVSIILDGENPWDYYANSGRDFLRFLFEGIRNEPSLEAVTLSEAAERAPAEKLDWLAPGSWAGSNFAIWMGHSEDHEAWAWIVRARAALMGQKGVVPEGHWNLAYQEILVAEGSDWMWWFGNDFSSDSDAVFDQLFRQHIGNVYHYAGLPLPDGLDEPIKKSLLGRRSVMPLPPEIEGATEGLRPA